ncbi:MAG: hypothetical protein J6S36_01190 [Eggerthellaceae bacterium]|nr:hypothetical protein [Eggerthellaceae bacterium]
MTLVRELDYRLRWMDFDRYGRIQPFALFDLCQDIATVHAEEMGISRDVMIAKGVFWAVVRQKVEIVKDPGYFQNVRVRTWPHTMTRFSFLRDFFIRDEAGDLLAKATSEWVLMDLETRKFASVKDYLEVPGAFDEARAFERKPRKLPDFEEGNCPVVEIVPGFTDVDLNGHVNNAKYADFVVNALNPGDEGAMKSIQIDYRHEALPGVPLAMHTLVEDGMVRSKGLKEDGTIAFACAIELR